MNKKVKILVCNVLMVSMILGLTACSQGSSTSGASGVSSGSSSASTAKHVTLKFWDIWTSDTDANKANIVKIVKDWNDANPNITIEAEAIENEAYKAKIKTAIAADEAPDLFTSWGAGFSQPFVASGKVLQLDDYLKDGTKEKLIDGTLSNVTYDNKVYGLPHTLSIGAFYCNTELFKNNNVKIPETYTELLTAVKAFRAKGITPIAVGEKDLWPGMFYYDILALREGGTKLNNDTLNKNGSFEDEAFVKAAGKLKELVDAKAFGDGALGVSRDESEVPFLQGKIPMYYNGSWVAGSLEKDDCPVKGKIVINKFPMIEDGKGDANEFLGGAVDCLMVAANTKYKEESVKALKYIAENMSKQEFTSGSGLPTWKVQVDETKLTPLTVQLNNLAKSSKGFVMWWDTYLAGADADTHKNLVAQIFGGKITPQDFGKQMQVLNKK